MYRLATEIGLTGWVLNDVNGVFVEVEGDVEDVQRFVARLEAEVPPVAHIDTLSVEWLEPGGFDEFEIRHSDGSGAKTAIILPDLATCAECLTDVENRTDRRHRYPFTNCTNCGPRFSIIRELPYDRPNTTMSSFTMCRSCRDEYDDPSNRRFHAQPNACQDCGPAVTHLDGAGNETTGDGAIEATVGDLIAGRIVALKGLGGYQLLADATNATAVGTLRERKHRPAKPFAVMVQDLDELDRVVDGTGAEHLLTGPSAPIVLLPERSTSGLAEGVSPPTSTIGVMLPTTPLHRLIAAGAARPLVATSGNLTDEPIAIDDTDAIERLEEIADSFLVHDRPIERHIDDSVTWVVDGAPQLVRRSRGYAPMPIASSTTLPTILATGAHLKNTVALSVGSNVFISQHIGDLETPRAEAAFAQVIDDLTRMYEATPSMVAHDAHPDYVSTRYAMDRSRFDDVPRVAVQHHHAHLASCLADNGTDEPALGITWDGTGWGLDGSIWGGEFLLGDASSFERVAHLRPFLLPGGEAAVREPRRSAAAVLREAGLDIDPALPGLASFASSELGILDQMMAKQVNSPTTTSAGRLFDAVSAMLGLVEVSTFEGHAAMALEHAADTLEDGSYAIPITRSDEAWVVDWAPLIRSIVDDLAVSVTPGRIAGKFHNALVGAIVGVAERVEHPRVALTGGCFQNRLLTERAASRLRSSGFDVLMHRSVPPNDGGISLGQVMVAAARHDTPGEASMPA